MKFSVIWLPVAEQELAKIWFASRVRSLVKEAAERIDQQLELSAEHAGESGYDNLRILIAPPLAVTYRLFATNRTVFVVDVRQIQGRRKP